MRESSVLVTGAHGFLGRHVAFHFGERGWHVIGMGHGEWRKGERQKWHIEEWRKCDITLRSLKAYVKEPNVIVHCAGSGSVAYSMSHPLEDFLKNVGTTAHVLEYVRLHAPETKVVLASSAGVYGRSEMQPIEEDSPLAPTSMYGYHKKMAEELCFAYGRSYAVSSAVVRLFSLYGNGLRKQLLWDTCMKASREENEYFGTGEETRDFLHVRDAAALLFQCAEHASPLCTVINGGSGAGIAVREMVSEVLTCFGFSENPKFNGSVRVGDPLHYAADISKALRLGWRPAVEWATGVREYVDWFKDSRR